MVVYCSFYEAPGCRHRISSNASTTEEATIVANLILDTEIMEGILEKEGVAGLVVIDEEYRAAVDEQVKKIMAAVSAKAKV
jgi:hypothetical protein